MSRVVFEDKLKYKRATSEAVGVNIKIGAATEDVVADLLEVVEWLEGKKAEEAAPSEEAPPEYEPYEEVHEDEGDEE